MKSNFSDNFWDKKGGGWKLLYKNFSSSIKSVREFKDYLSECRRNESAYAKKLKKFKFSKSHYSSMSPVWNDLLTVFYNTNANVHLAFQLKLNELIADLKKYHKYLANKRERINQNELHTKKTIKLFRRLTTKLAKSRELFNKLNLKYDTAPESDLVKKQKLKSRLDLAKHDYMSSVESYNLVRKEYIKKFVDSCNMFQMEEINHLKTMRSFINTYTSLIEHLNLARQKIFMEMCHKLNENYTNEFLYENLICIKRTGSERPLDAQFVKPIHPDFTKLSLKRTALAKTASNSSTSTTSQSKPLLSGESVTCKQRKLSFLQRTNSGLGKSAAVSRSNLLIVAVVSEAFDKQIEKINEFEKEKNKSFVHATCETTTTSTQVASQAMIAKATSSSSLAVGKNAFFENLDDFIESIKTKHAIRSRV